MVAAAVILNHEVAESRESPLTILLFMVSPHLYAYFLNAGWSAISDHKVPRSFVLHLALHWLQVFLHDDSRSSRACGYVIPRPEPDCWCSYRTHDTPTVINMATGHLYSTTNMLCLVKWQEQYISGRLDFSTGGQIVFLTLLAIVPSCPTIRP